MLEAVDPGMPPKSAGDPGESAISAGSVSGGSLSHLPWSQIPAFKPGETDINDYTKRLEFIAGLWPTEHLSQLAPRAAMLCEGSAFKRVMRIEPQKLKVNSTAGVQAIVTSLGGIWGRSKFESKFEKFEKAIFGTSQRSDETHESYLARHDHHFEELLQMRVSLEEIRAYVLLRNSGLGAEDKKRLIVDSGEILEYGSVVSSLKLLGSKFFQDVQGGAKFSTRTKVYDVMYTQEDEVDGSWTETQGDSSEIALLADVTDDLPQLESLAEEGDQDALACLQFEEGLIDILQSDRDTAVCLNAYLDARKRLNDRNKNRGFWNSGGKKGKGKSKGFGKGFRPRKSLAQRILESECKRCFQKGHWKAECPLRFQNANASESGTNSKDPSAFAGTVTTALNEGEDQPEDMIPATDLEAGTGTPEKLSYVAEIFFGTTQKETQPYRRKTPESSKILTSILPSLLGRLRNRLSPQPKEVDRVVQTRQVGSLHAEAFFVSHGPFGIVDLGASQTVIGRKQVQEVLSCMPSHIRARVKSVPCNMVFRFGNSSTVECHEARLIPLSNWFIKLCVVDSETPFLISNNVFRTLGAQIDTLTDTVHFARLGVTLTLSKRKLYLLDFCALVEKASKGNSSSPEIPTGHVLTAVGNSCDSLSSSDEQHETAIVHQSQSDSSSLNCDIREHPKPSERLQLSHGASRDADTGFGREIPPSDGEDRPRGRGISGHDLSRVGSKDDQFWRLQDRPNLLTCGSHGCNLRAVVCQEVCHEHQEEPSRVHPLHQTPCGTPGGRGPTQGEPTGQSEGLQQESGQTSILDGVTESSDGIRDMGHDSSRELRPRRSFS